MKIFWMDTETSGTDPAKHGLIQIGYIVEIDYKPKVTGNIFIDPTEYGKELDPEALKYNGITPAEIKEKSSPINETWLELHRMLGIYIDRYDRNDKFVIGGHNVQFDIDFLKSLWDYFGDKYFYSYFQIGTSIDTKKLASWWMWTGGFEINPASTKINDIADALGIEREGKEHDALFDITITRECAVRMKGKTLYRLENNKTVKIIDEETKIIIEKND